MRAPSSRPPGRSRSRAPRPPRTTFPEKTGDGVPTGQASIQLFTHSGYISNGGGLGTAPPALTVAPAADGSSCATATSTECRWNRLDALFGYFAANGLDSVELFGHAGLPTNENIDGPYGWKQYRALLDKHNLHAAGWHGSLNEAAWPARVAAAKVIGLDYIGTRQRPGRRHNLNTYDQILRSAETLNRLGKYSVENGVGPVYLHNHTGEFDNKYVDNGVLKTAWDILIERTDPRYVAFQVDAFWASDAFDDATGAATAAFINKYPTRVKLMHVKDGTNVARNRARPTAAAARRGFGTGEVDYRPILAAAKSKRPVLPPGARRRRTADVDTFTDRAQPQGRPRRRRAGAVRLLADVRRRAGRPAAAANCSRSRSRTPATRRWRSPRVALGDTAASRARRRVHAATSVPADLHRRPARRGLGDQRGLELTVNVGFNPRAPADQVGRAPAVHVQRRRRDGVDPARRHQRQRRPARSRRRHRREPAHAGPRARAASARSCRAPRVTTRPTRLTASRTDTPDATLSVADAERHRHRQPRQRHVRAAQPLQVSAEQRGQPDDGVHAAARDRRAAVAAHLHRPDPVPTASRSASVSRSARTRALRGAYGKTLTFTLSTTTP